MNSTPGKFLKVAIQLKFNVYQKLELKSEEIKSLGIVLY